MHLGRALLGIATATLATGGLFTAAAFVEAPQNAQFEVPLAYPEFDPNQVGTSRFADAGQYYPGERKPYQAMVHRSLSLKSLERKSSPKRSS